MAEDTEFVFAGAEAGTLELRTPVTRAQFELWIAPELEQIAAAVDDLLAAASLPPAAIDRVFLTGGTSFVPAVRRIFEQRFGGGVSRPATSSRRWRKGWRWPGCGR